MASACLLSFAAALGCSYVFTTPPVLPRSLDSQTCLTCAPLPSAARFCTLHCAEPWPALPETPDLRSHSPFPLPCMLQCTPNLHAKLHLIQAGAFILNRTRVSEPAGHYTPSKQALAIAMCTQSFAAAANACESLKAAPQVAERSNHSWGSQRGGLTHIPAEVLTNMCVGVQGLYVPLMHSTCSLLPKPEQKQSP